MTINDLDLNALEIPEQGSLPTNINDLDVSGLNIKDLDITQLDIGVQEGDTSQMPESFMQRASQATKIPMTEESKIQADRDNRIANVKAGNYGDESIIDNFYKLTMGEEAYKNKKLSEAMKYGKEEVEFAGGDTRAQDFTRGIAATTYGFQQAGLDLNELVGLEQPEKIKQVESKIANINDAIKDKDFFSSATLGRIIPTLITLPIQYQSKMVAAIIEGSLAYGEARGSGLSKGESLTTGVIAGGATAGIMKILDSLGAGANRELFQYMKEHNNIADDEAEAIFANWSKVNETDGSFADKTKAIVDSLGEKGAVLTKESAQYSPEATKVVEGNIKARRKAIEKAIATDFNTQTFANDINKGIDAVGKNYEATKLKISNNIVKPIKTSIPDALDDITASDAKSAKDILSKENLQVADLVDAMPHINSMINRSKGVNKNNWVNVKNEVDANLKKSLSKSEYNEWKLANEDYSKMMSVKESAIGKTILKTITKGKDQITPKAAIQKLRQMNIGSATFKDLEFLVGTEKVAKLEKEVIKSALGRAQEDIDWLQISKALDKKGFITEEGKSLQSLIDTISKSFATDDKLKALIEKL